MEKNKDFFSTFEEYLWHTPAELAVIDLIARIPAHASPPVQWTKEIDNGKE